MCMVLVAATDALSIRIDLATAVTGKHHQVFHYYLNTNFFPLQTTAFVSRCSWKKFLPVFCDEDGSRAARPPQRGGQTQRGRTLLPGVCHLQGRAGGDIRLFFHALIHHSNTLSVSRPTLSIWSPT